MSFTESEHREQICETGKLMWQMGMAPSTSGNISVLLEDNTVLITPTGKAKGFMKPDQLIVVNKEAKVIRGEGHPTTETLMHLSLYEENSSIKAVVHAHPPFATSFSVAGKLLDTGLVPEAVISCGSFPLVEFEMPGSQELATAVAPFANDYEAIMLANHGVLCWGKNLESAYHRLETIEFSAKVSLLANMLGGAKEIEPRHIETLMQIRSLLKGQ